MAPNEIEELFDIVDERNEVIGQRPRAEVHRLGLRHRAVHILVFNRRGEMFLQQRSLTKDTHPGVWDSSTSGHLLPGESYADAAVRELREELDARLELPLQEILRIDACAVTGQEFVRVYQGIAEGPFRLHPQEIRGGGWFPADAIRWWIEQRPGDFAPALPFIWRHLPTTLRLIPS